MNYLKSFLKKPKTENLKMVNIITGGQLSITRSIIKKYCEIKHDDINKDEFLILINKDNYIKNNSQYKNQNLNVEDDINQYLYSEISSKYNYPIKCFNNEDDIKKYIVESKMKIKNLFHLDHIELFTDYINSDHILNMNNRILESLDYSESTLNSSSEADIKDNQKEKEEEVKERNEKNNKENNKKIEIDYEEVKNIIKKYIENPISLSSSFRNEDYLKNSKILHLTLQKPFPLPKVFKPNEMLKNQIMNFRYLMKEKSLKIKPDQVNLIEIGIVNLRTIDKEYINFINLYVDQAILDKSIIDHKPYSDIRKKTSNYNTYYDKAVDLVTYFLDSESFSNVVKKRKDNIYYIDIEKINTVKI